MGTAKAALEWHGSTLLRRVVGIVARAVDGPVVVVRAPRQPLPPLPVRRRGRRGRRRGPGSAGRDRGRARGPARVVRTVAFVCATDLPLLTPTCVRTIVAALSDGRRDRCPARRRSRPPAGGRLPHRSGAEGASPARRGRAPRDRAPRRRRARRVCRHRPRCARCLTNLNTAEEYRAARALPRAPRSRCTAAGRSRTCAPRRWAPVREPPCRGRPRHAQRPGPSRRPRDPPGRGDRVAVRPPPANE